MYDSDALTAAEVAHIHVGYNLKISHFFPFSFPALLIPLITLSDLLSYHPQLSKVTRKARSTQDTLNKYSDKRAWTGASQYSTINAEV